MKKEILSVTILVLFFIAAVGSGSSSSTINSSRSSHYSSDAYSTPAASGICNACGGRGYITRNGNRETCACGGTGKAISFPKSK